MNSYVACGFLLVLIGGAANTYAASVALPTCGGTASAKSINLLKPTNPPRECEYHIKAYSSNVCQLRIDFAMTLAQPTLEEDDETGLTYAECTQDYFEVNGLRLCGTEIWQHIYVPFNASAGAKTVDLLISLANRAGATWLPTPEWDMTVTQLECPDGAAIRQMEAAEEDEQNVEDGEQNELNELPPGPEARASIKDGFYVAPPGCLQYFPQAKGVVKSFNYNDGDGVYPSKMNYAICFRRTANTTELNIRSYFFRVGAERAFVNLLTDSFCYSGTSKALNPDYLMVPQAILNETSTRATYFCGSTDNDVVITSNNPGPLMVLFNSDDVYGETSEGFAFTYTVQ